MGTAGDGSGGGDDDGDNVKADEATNTHHGQRLQSGPLSISSFRSTYAFLHHLSLFGLVLLYCYCCERHPPNPHAKKSYDRD